MAKLTLNWSDTIFQQTVSSAYCDNHSKTWISVLYKRTISAETKWNFLFSTTSLKNNCRKHHSQKCDNHYDFDSDISFYQLWNPLCHNNKLSVHSNNNIQIQPAYHKTCNRHKESSIFSLFLIPLSPMLAVFYFSPPPNCRHVLWTKTLGVFHTFSIVVPLKLCVKWNAFERFSWTRMNWGLFWQCAEAECTTSTIMYYTTLL